MDTVFYAVLEMGLGHATRSLPVIRALQESGREVVVGGDGRSLDLLQQELPSTRFVDLPPYGIRYGSRGADLLGLSLQAPGMLRAIRAEREVTRKVVEERGIGLIVSDHRYGCAHPDVPSWLVSHQLRFAAPGLLQRLEHIGALFNAHHHRRFSGVIVPDSPEGKGGLLSGRLSEAHLTPVPVVWPGPLSSIRRREDLDEDIDLFVSISGPEPQRTALETAVLDQVRSVPGRRVVALGRPESDRVEEPEEGLTVHSHLDRLSLEEVMNRSRVVVARPGYSTIMELAETGRRALLVPTPGQTEQEYLARRCRERNWAKTVLQKRLDLPRDLEAAQETGGFPEGLRTEQTLRGLLPILTGG